MFSKEIAKMTVKEKLKNKARFGLGRVNYPYEDYLFVKICKLWSFDFGIVPCLVGV